MVENIDYNDIHIEHNVDESKISDGDFNEEKNKEQAQTIRQEREEAKRKQGEEAESLFQQNFPDEASTIEHLWELASKNDIDKNRKKHIGTRYLTDIFEHLWELVSKNDIEWLWKYLWLNLDIELINLVKK